MRLFRSKNRVRKKDYGNKGKPFWLKKYENANYITQQRVRFTFYLCIVLILVSVSLSLVTSYNQLVNPLYKNVHLPSIIPQFVAVVIFIFSTYILIKGHLNVTTNIILTTALAVVWFIMWFDRNHSIQRLGSIAYIIAILSMAPMIIGKKNYHILLYTGANLFMLFIFLYVFKNDLMISEVQLRDYILDTTVPIIFVGIIGYNIFNINRNALNRAEEVLSEREKTELLLAASERRYREMTEFLPQAVFESDSHGNLQYINKTGLKLFNRSEDDVRKGINLFTLVEERERIKQNVERLLQGELSTGSFYTTRKKCGEIVPVQIFSSVIKDKGISIGIRSIAIDITDRIEAEKAIRQSQEHFKTLIDSAPIAISLSDLNGQYLVVNKNFAEITGLPAEKIIGKTPKDIGITIDEETEELIRNSLAEKGLVENLEAIIYENGEKKIDALYSSRQIVLNNENTILSSIINITEKKKNEKELEKYRNHLEVLVRERAEGLAAANKELTATNEELQSQHEELLTALENLKQTQQKLVLSEKMASLGVLSAGVAHEINNPLNYINGGVLGIEKYVREKLTEHHEPLSELFQAVAEGVRRVSTIVDSLNRYYRQTHAVSQLCDVHSVIDDCLLFLRKKIRDNIKIIELGT